MRSTVTLDDDVLDEVKRIGRAEGIGVSDATNRLIRSGMALRQKRVTRVTGNLIPDGQLAALAIEYGLQVMTADTDFTRFPEVSFVNPLI